MSTSLRIHSRHIVRWCPVCGCPLHIGVHLFGETVACGHCGGGFTASDADDLTGGMTSRVDRLLGCASHVLKEPSGQFDDVHRLQVGTGHEQAYTGVPATAFKPAAICEPDCVATCPRVRRIKEVLLVEYRDEVFARLSADLAENGLQVERVCTAHGVRGHFASHRPELAILNMDMPVESGWLMASKLRLGTPATHIWIYAPRVPSPVDQHFAQFLAVELVQYPGDLISLAAEILRRVLDPAAVIPARQNEMSDRRR